MLEPHVDDIHLLTGHLLGGDTTTIDSIYVRDSSVVCDDGVVLCRMGKEARRQEPDAIAAWLADNGQAPLGRIDGEGLLEGGDLVWLDEKTVAVGQGYRSNNDGIAQLSALLGDDITVVPVPLPHWNGPGDVLHLMSMLSPLADDLMLVHSRLMPVSFRQHLIDSGIELLELPEDEYHTLGGNVLAIAPRCCLLLAGNPRTRALLESAGCEVIEFAGEEICLKGEGGPTCLTRPMRREIRN